MSIHEPWAPTRFTNPGGFNEIGSERRFGVELEYFDVSRYKELQGNTIFGAKDDGSVDGEFYSPVLQGDNGLAECDNFCTLAREKGFRAAEGAGYHAHFDLSRENEKHLKSIVLGYHFTYPFWKLTVPQHRAESHWSEAHDFDVSDIKSINSKDRMREFASRGRYYWANFSAFNKFGTVELRIHESTHSGHDVTNWIKAHTRFLDALAGLLPSRVEAVFANKSLPDLVREMRVVLRSPDVMAHLTGRMNRFNPGCRSRQGVAATVTTDESDDFDDDYEDSEDED